MQKSIAASFLRKKGKQSKVKVKYGPLKTQADQKIPKLTFPICSPKLWFYQSQGQKHLELGLIVMSGSPKLFIPSLPGM